MERVDGAEVAVPLGQKYVEEPAVVQQEQPPAPRPTQPKTAQPLEDQMESVKQKMGHLIAGFLIRSRRLSRQLPKRSFQSDSRRRHRGPPGSPALGSKCSRWVRAGEAQPGLSQSHQNPVCFHPSVVPSRPTEQQPSSSRTQIFLQPELLRNSRRIARKSATNFAKQGSSGALNAAR